MNISCETCRRWRDRIACARLENDPRKTAMLEKLYVAHLQSDHEVRFRPVVEWRGVQWIEVRT
jgi:cupin superfamily acireductone dioxygenase involved in methionine salvage